MPVASIPTLSPSIIDDCAAFLFRLKPLIFVPPSYIFVTFDIPRLLTFKDFGVTFSVPTKVRFGNVLVIVAFVKSYPPTTKLPDDELVGFITVTANVAAPAPLEIL